MRRTISLSEYVKKRTGVTLGASGSMRHMLKRSLGAGSFYQFWHYWNPIWGYYLSRNVMKPLAQFLPIWMATLLTFIVSGGIHDLAVSLVKWELTFFFTPWFVLMGVLVLATKKFSISYHQYHWAIRMSINSLFLVASLVLTMLFTRLYV